MARGVTIRNVVVPACILSILVSAIVLIGCGAQTPEQVIKTYCAACEKHDTNTVWNLMSVNMKKTAGSKAAVEKEFAMMSRPMESTVEKVTVNGDKATAEVTTTVPEDSANWKWTASLVTENGVWKVDAAGIETQ